ncbi:uncharacterized protein DUF4367 [Hydrogenoanaerobacterium saccharovorans]|uniref:DUF4367 domain-containing protein n=1 Tax=Hydrogenoanaerobacterium saccharovorans TaxID=474960 RepID=A0A1H7YM33_9FIRM|nr:DUF4367 domain-containing protein [Hydrogenoanaerobacterium saccharovorans]RPF49132.1 uncharacterized protein DUF4367 [Hydrogenoanaerobacterium saccharovorans]SEM47170.1 protein of unknown function [Hydrogenoanaerobacterium saccharovorans]
MSKQNINVELFDLMLKRAAEDYIEQEGEKIKQEYDTVDEFEPSAEFERKMRKLIKKHEKKKRRLPKPLRTVAAIFAVIIVGSSTLILSVDAIRTEFFNYVLSLRDNYGVVLNDKVTYADLTYDISEMPQNWDYIYVPTRLPKGFTNITMKWQQGSLRISYITKDGERISFLEEKITNKQTFFDTENVDYKKIAVGDNIAFLNSKDGRHTLVLEIDGYKFVLKGNDPLTSNALIKIAASIEKYK